MKDKKPLMRLKNCTCLLKRWKKLLKKSSKEDKKRNNTEKQNEYFTSEEAFNHTQELKIQFESIPQQ